MVDVLIIQFQKAKLEVCHSVFVPRAKLVQILGAPFDGQNATEGVTTGW